MNFVGKTVLYSGSVSLRMIPILAITTYGALMLLNMLAGYPWLIVVVCGLVYLPLLAFLYIMAIRCGLTALKATEPPLSKKYFPATVRFLRFPLMITNLLITVVGVGGSFVLLTFFAPEKLAELQRVLFIAEDVPLDEMIYAIADLPLAIVLLFSFAFGLGMSFTGANAGATAHWIGERDSNLDMIWGATRQWHHLLTVVLLTLIAPLVGVVFWLGGPMAPLWQITTLTTPAALGTGVLLLWSLCAISAAQAIAFVMTRDENVEMEAQEKVEMTGPVYDDSEVRALRLKRMERSKMSTAEQPAE